MIISLDKYKATGGGGSGGTENTYSIYDGSIDANGLRTIGWDDESIGYFKDNCVNWYGWDNDSYKVSSGNKSIYSNLISLPNIQIYKIREYQYDADFRFCPMILIPQANSLFESFGHLEYIPKLDTSAFNNFSLMFYECRKLKTIPKLNTSNATNMDRMFQDCSSLKGVPLLDTSNVTNMNRMFQGCNNLNSVPLFDTSNVTNMQYIFYNCAILNSVPLFDTSKVTNMNGMFAGCNNLNSVPLFNTSKVTSMDSMLMGCRNLESVPLFDTSNVTNMTYMFAWCDVLNNVPSFDTSKVRDINCIFEGCHNLTRIESIDLSAVENGIELSYDGHPPFEYIGFNGSLNPDYIHLDYYPSLDNESIMSALQAASRTTDDLKSKELYLPNKTYFGDANVPEGLVDLVNECTSKNWSITGLTIITDEDLENAGNPDEAIPVTLQEFIEAEPNTNQWYRLTVTLYNCPKLEAGIWCVSEEGFEPPVWFEGKPTVLINGITNDGLRFDYDYWSWSEFPGDGSTITILTRKHYTEEDIEIGTVDGWSITIPAGATFGGKFNGSPLAIYVE